MKIIQISNFIKIRSMGADRQTDRHHKANSLLLMWLYNSFIEFWPSQPTLSFFFYPGQEPSNLVLFNFCIPFLTSSTHRVFGLLLAFLRWVSSSILPLPFSYLASFRCDRASSVKLIVAFRNFVNAPKNDKAVPNLTSLN